MPYRFGSETLTEVTCARVAVQVEAPDGRRAVGWGETPLNVQWAWPGNLSYAERLSAMVDLCRQIACSWASSPRQGHALEVGHSFLQRDLPTLLRQANASRQNREEIPWLAALVCASPFDIALHDAYGKFQGEPVYATYSSAFMNHDLSHYLQPAEGSRVSFQGLYPEDFLCSPPSRLYAWHSVGALDPLTDEDRRGDEPEDGYPVTLTDWISEDELKCLKLKLSGVDAHWDYRRIVRTAEIAYERGVHWLSLDFNCTVQHPSYVTTILDRLMHEHPRYYGMVLYVEQPFPYDLQRHQLDVHSVAARKPLLLDESAHDWNLVRLGRSLGWTGVALKTCKTQTGAILTLCWAKAHGMTVMVQDLTNPMLAQIPHVLLAAHAGTMMGLETNAPQFYPEASRPESRVHPGLYRRRQGMVDLGTIRGPGFGYRLEEIQRNLPTPDACFGRW